MDNLKDGLNEDDSLEKEVHVLNDWRSITYAQLVQMGATPLLLRFGGVIPMLQHFYPNHKWEDHSNRNLKRKSQRLLFDRVKTLLPSVDSNGDPIEVFTEYPHPTLKFPWSEMSVQFDVYIPSYRLALEYQGTQHYTSNNFVADVESNRRK